MTLTGTFFGFAAPAGIAPFRSGVRAFRRWREERGIETVAHDRETGLSLLL